MAKVDVEPGRISRSFPLLWLYYGTGHLLAVLILAVLVFVLPSGWLFVVLTLLPSLIQQVVFSYWGPYTPAWPPIVQSLMFPPWGWIMILINSALYGAVFAWLHRAIRK